MPVDGVIKSAAVLDSIGFFARDPDTFSYLTKFWYGNNTVVSKTPFKTPTTLYYPFEWFPLLNPEAQSMIETWMSNVTTALNMTKVDLNVTKIFTETNTFNGTLSEWQSPIFTLSGWDNYYAVGEKLESAWKAAHDGQRPPVDPTVPYSSGCH